MQIQSKLSARLRFAHAMKQFRQERGLSQEKLAEVTGLHRTYIGSVERGERNISVDNMDAIAMAMELDIGFFFCSPANASDTNSLVRTSLTPDMQSHPKPIGAESHARKP